MPETQSDFLFKRKDQKALVNDSKSKSKISTLEVILNQKSDLKSRFQIK